MVAIFACALSSQDSVAESDTTSLIAKYSNWTHDRVIRGLRSAN